jgi:membrane-associated phospholipid phosphatase
MKQIATIISTILEPMILLPLVCILYASHVGVPLLVIFLWFVLILGPIVGHRLWLQKQGIDWDIKDRKNRSKPFIKLIIFTFVMSIAMWIFEPRLLPPLLLFLIWIMGFYIITTRYTKISGHTGGDALATGLFIQSFGWNFWPVLFIVPLVAWSRIIRKDHTLLQVIAGALYSWTLVLIYSKFII